VPFAESPGFSFGAADSIALAQVINAIKPKQAILFLTSALTDSASVEFPEACALWRSLRSILEIREALGRGLGQNYIAEYAARTRLHPSPAPANK
jgi:hypothetical protein